MVKPGFRPVFHQKRVVLAFSCLELLWFDVELLWFNIEPLWFDILKDEMFCSISGCLCPLSNCSGLDIRMFWLDIEPVIAGIGLDCFKIEFLHQDRSSMSGSDCANSIPGFNNSRRG